MSRSVRKGGHGHLGSDDARISVTIPLVVDVIRTPAAS
jgi:hypothetical protein